MNYPVGHYVIIIKNEVNLYGAYILRSLRNVT